MTDKEEQHVSDDFDARVTSIAVLAEPVRRALYRFVVGQSEPVSREEAATGTDVALHTAKFHLDKLVEDGLLDVEYRRPQDAGDRGRDAPPSSIGVPPGRCRSASPTADTSWPGVFSRRP